MLDVAQHKSSTDSNISQNDKRRKIRQSLFTFCLSCADLLLNCRISRIWKFLKKSFHTKLVGTTGTFRIHGLYRTMGPKSKSQFFLLYGILADGPTHY